MTGEPGKRWRYTIHYSTYYTNMYNFTDLDLETMKYVINHAKKTVKLSAYHFHE